MANIDIKVSPVNLLPWSNMEDWANGTSAPPTEHSLTGVDALASRESTIKKIGNYSVKVARDGNDATLFTTLDNYDEYLGRRMTFGCWVRVSTADRARLAIDDGVGSTESAYHTGGGDWEYLTVTHNVDASATKIQCEMQVNSGNVTAYFDGGGLYLGNHGLIDLTDYADWSGRKVATRYIDQSYESPRRDGQKVLNARLQSKSISFDVMVIGSTATAKRTNLDALQTYLNSINKLPNGNTEYKELYFFDDRYYKCILDGFDPDDQAAGRISKARAKFNIFDPYEYAVNRTRQEETLTGTTSFTVTTNGTASVFPLISILNSSSNISSVTVENLTTGQKVSYSGTLITSDYLVIDTENLDVTNDGVSDIGNVANEIGITLAPGANVIKVTGVALGECTIDWTDRWF